MGMLAIWRTRVMGGRMVSERKGSPKTQAEWFGDQALAAWRQAQSALGEHSAIDDSRLDEARRWLERARRYAPKDTTIALSLAVVLLRQGDDRAPSMFSEITESHDLREAWLGLAAARSAAGETGAASDALAAALSRHVVPAGVDISDLAGRIADNADRPGWCCHRGDGRLEIALQRTDRKGLRVHLDGVSLRSVPRRIPHDGSMLTLTWEGKPLVGSPLDLARMRTLEGFVEVSAGGLVGWAWHPANPERDPVLYIRPDQGGKALRIVATDGDMPAERPLAQPRRFAVPATAVAGWSGPVHVTGEDRRELPGSPLDPGSELAAASAVARAIGAIRPAQHRRRSSGEVSIDPAALAVPADITGTAARAPLDPGRPIAVVVPAYRDANLTLDCLRAVRRTMPPGTRLIVVDDATPEPDLAKALDDLVSHGEIQLLRHGTNQGFPAAANTGMRAAMSLAGTMDILLLNNDALVTKGAIASLRKAVQGRPDIGTATPLSNDATILSYPDHRGGNPLLDARALTGLAKLAARANRDVVVDIPTAVGFCMYIRRECLADVGLFRDDIFAQGYGEENDFCIRARHLGWRHVAAADVYVAHAEGRSFKHGALGAARKALIERNLAILERLHPGYHALIEAHGTADPLARARRRLDTARWAARRPRHLGRSAILVTHDSGGGVERVVEARCAALCADGYRPIVLRPMRDATASSTDDRAYLPGACLVCDGTLRDTPNLRFAIPGELGELAELLRADRPEFLEIHHLLGHDHAVFGLATHLGIPWDIQVHDYAWLCPRITLIGTERRYCGEPTNPAVCDACIADAGRRDEQDLPVADLLARSAADLSAARRVIAPSSDVANRVIRHFPEIEPDVQVLEDDASWPPARPMRADVPRRVAIIGAIGIEKGYDVLLACARDAAARAISLEFVVIGHTIDDERLFATGRVFVTGPYREENALTEIQAQSPDLAFLPSIWPETWCFTVGHAWRAGLWVAAFDIGAPAERIRRTGRGWLLPLGLPASAINNYLLNTAY